jgi:fatty acid-binding protein DegV
MLALKHGEIISVGVARTHSSACTRIAQQVASLGKIEQLIAGESSPGAGQQLSAILTAHTGPATIAVAAVIRER